MTSEPRVLNRKFDYVPEDSVYVGRPSKWGNPFCHLEGKGKFFVLTREEAIAKHREWFLSQPSLIEAAQKELRGRDLVCWCSPLECHAEVLLEIANGELK